MATAASPLRFISPGQLILCVVLFFLPWIEVQCVPNPGAAKKGVEGLALPGMAGPRPFVSQSGLQVATGGLSFADPDLKRMAEMGGGAGGAGGMGGMPGGGGAAGAKKEPETGAAFLLFLYPIALVGGIVIGFVMPPGGTRRVALAGCCGAALALVLLQAVIGFPIERDVATEAQKPKMGGGEPEISMRVAWKLPLYATFGLLLGALGTAFVDGGTPKPRRPRDEDDFDAADEDDDDDREPRPKRRPRDDD